MSDPDPDENEFLFDGDSLPMNLFEKQFELPAIPSELSEIQAETQPNASKPTEPAFEPQLVEEFDLPPSEPSPLIDAATLAAAAEGFHCLRCLRPCRPEQRRRVGSVGGVSLHCQHCKKEIPIDYWNNWRLMPSIKFSLVGLRGNGKTCFLQGLVKRFGSLGSPHWPKFRYQPVSTADTATLRTWLEQVDQGHLPGPNQVEADTVALKLRGVPGIGDMFLLMFDISGEAFEHKHYLQNNAAFVQRSQVVTLLVSLTDTHDSFKLTAMMQLLQEGLQEVGAEPRDISLVIALTKGDRLMLDKTLPQSARNALSAESSCDPFDASRLRTISNDLEAWLLAHPDNFRTFALNSRDVFGDVQYTIFSGTGFETDGKNSAFERRPRNVIDPLLLLIQSSLPRATLTAGAVCETYFSLEEAVVAARQVTGPAVIELSAGQFRLEQTLILNTPIRLSGKGCDKTIISGDCAKCLVSVKSPDAIIENIGFIHEGTQAASVAQVRGGKFSFSGCRFSGGIKNSVTKLHGHGLEVLGTSSGTVVGCEAASNHGAGLRMAGTAIATLIGNRSLDNQFGISLSNSCRAVVREKNTCLHNTHGVGIFEEANVELHGNICHNNRQYGIVDNSRGQSVITQNCCTNEPDSIQQNVGICIQGAARPEVTRNVCNHQVKDGIQVGQGARPTLEANTSSRNTRYGIGVFDASAPIVTNNICAENSVGICVGKQVLRAAKIREKSNQCRRNKSKDFVDLRPGGLWS